MQSPTTTAAEWSASPTSGHDGRRLGRLLTKWLIRAAGVLAYIVAVILLWELIILVLHLRGYIMPSPSAVWHAGSQSAGLLISNSWITIYEALMGLAISFVVGVGLAILIVYVPLLRQALMPGIVALNAVPKVVVAPVLVIWIGLGAESKIALAFLLTFFPILVNATRGLEEVEPDLLDYFRLMGASSLKTFRKARFPNSLPGIFDGLRIALPIAFIGAVIGEFVASNSGIGYQIILAYSNFNTPLVFAAAVLIGVISVLCYGILVGVEKHFLKWAPSRRKA